MSNNEPAAGHRNPMGRLILGMRHGEPRLRRHSIISEMLVTGLVQILHLKVWLARALLRSYIRVGASMYRRPTTALAVRGATAVVTREPDLLIAQRRLQRFISRILAAKLTFALVLAILTLSYTNPYTPPGFEGYVYEHPRIIGAGGFKGAQTGPANYGISFWNNKAINIDIRPDTHNEKIEAVTRDDLTITLQFSAVLAIAPGHVIEIVNDYGGEDWYPRFVRPRFRSLVQDAVQRRNSLDVNRQRTQIEDEVRAGLLAYLNSTPFRLRDLSETDMSYPDRIAQAVQRKLEAHELLQEKDTQIEIARRDAEIDVTRAQGQSEAQRLVSATLTPLFLQHEAIEAQGRGLASSSKTTVYVPTGVSGMPLIDTSSAAPKPANQP